MHLLRIHKDRGSTGVAVTAAINYLRDVEAATQRPRARTIASDLESQLADLMGLADALAVMCGGGNDLPTKPVRAIAYTIERIVQDVEKKRCELIDEAA